MIALLDDDGTLIGYYEKHEYRDAENCNVKCISVKCISLIADENNLRERLTAVWHYSIPHIAAAGIKFETD